MDVYEQLKQINIGLDRKFPNGWNPFQMMSRLAEEVGELAEQVNHFEDTGVKGVKHGEPDKRKLADEVKGTVLVALQILEYYHAEPEFQASIEHMLDHLKHNGFLE